MTQEPVSPMVLVILDGWGHRDEDDGNAINNARTPVIDSLWTAYPHTLIQTSGKDVGLPDGQMGNSEVGHLNIGAGRIVPQELVRISDAVDDGSIQENRALLNICQKVRYNSGKLHLVGLCSEGGVHSHLNHLFGLLDMAKAQDIGDVCIHACRQCAFLWKAIDLRGGCCCQLSECLRSPTPLADHGVKHQW